MCVLKCIYAYLTHLVNIHIIVLSLPKCFSHFEKFKKMFSTDKNIPKRAEILLLEFEETIDMDNFICM